MSAAGLVIPEAVAKHIADAMLGPGSSDMPDRVEMAVMALTEVAPTLLAAWVPPPVQCTNTSCFNVTCELSEGHEGFHTAHLGTASAAWAAGRAS